MFNPNKAPSADEIKSARKEAGLTQKESGLQLGSSASTWQAYELDQRKMPLLKWRAYLNTNKLPKLEEKPITPEMLKK